MIDAMKRYRLVRTLIAIIFITIFSVPAYLKLSGIAFSLTMTLTIIFSLALLAFVYGYLLSRYKSGITENYNGPQCVALINGYEASPLYNIFSSIVFDSLYGGLIGISFYIITAINAEFNYCQDLEFYIVTIMAVLGLVFKVISPEHEVRFLYSLLKENIDLN